MSSYNNNDNKLTSLLNEEVQIKEKLEKINVQENNSNVCAFNAIKLQSKINKLHNEIKNVILGKPDNDNSIA